MEVLNTRVCYQSLHTTAIFCLGYLLSDGGQRSYAHCILIWCPTARVVFMRCIAMEQLQLIMIV